MNFHLDLRKKAGSAALEEKVTVIARGHCRFDVEDAGTPRTILDCDKEPVRKWSEEAAMSKELSTSEKSSKPRCDFLVFAGQSRLTVVAVEMKGRSPDAREAAAQLQAGARLADQLAQSVDVDKFVALLLHQGMKHTAQLQVLGNSRVTFRGRKYLIVQKRCGTIWRQLPW